MKKIDFKMEEVISSHIEERNGTMEWQQPLQRMKRRITTNGIELPAEIKGRSDVSLGTPVEWPVKWLNLLSP